jgi:hypothetical protein
MQTEKIKPDLIISIRKIQVEEDNLIEEGGKPFWVLKQVLG